MRSPNPAYSLPDWQLIACSYLKQSPALFQNVFKLSAFFSKFWNILPFFNISLPFFWKIALMPLLSIIGPGWAFSLHINNDHNYVSSYISYSWMETGLKRQESFSSGAMPSPNILDLARFRQKLPLPDSQIGACLSTIVIWCDYTRSSYVTSIRYKDK